MRSIRTAFLLSLVSSSLLAASYPYKVTVTALLPQIQHGTGMTFTAHSSPSPPSSATYIFKAQRVFPCVEPEETLQDSPYTSKSWSSPQSGEYRITVVLTMPTIQKGVRETVGVGSMIFRFTPNPNPGVGHIDFYPPTSSALPPNATIKAAIPGWPLPTFQRFTFSCFSVIGQAICTSRRHESAPTTAYYYDWLVQSTGQGQIGVTVAVERFTQEPCQWVGTGWANVFYNVGTP